MTRKRHRINHHPTQKELQALRALVQLGTIKLAAESLGVNYHTFDSRIDRLRVKTGCRHMPQLIGHAAQMGWLSRLEIKTDVCGRPD